MQDENNKILIICPSMWPKMNSWGETQRMYYLANHLAESGWKVYTIAPGFNKMQTGQEREIKYTSCFLETKKLEEASEKTLEYKNKNKRFYQKIRKAAAALLVPVINWFYNEPDCLGGIYKQLWIWKNKREIESYIIRNKIERVIISVPAFTLMQLGKAIHKKRPDIEIIYDYRDPWHLWNGKKNFAYCKEKKYLTYANKIIGFSNTFSEDMIQKMGVDPKRIYTVYNGYSENAWENFEKNFSFKEESRKQKLCLTFTGNITLLDRKDNFRNPCKLIEIVKNFPEVELYFIGVRDPRAGTTEKNVHFVGNVSQNESFAYMMQSDILISIHDTEDNSGKYIVSGKFYDYMRSGKVIWQIGSSKSLMTQMIQEYHLGIWCENTKDELENMLRKLVQSWRKGSIKELRNCDIKEVNMFSREYQNKKYNDILRENSI